MTVLRLPTTSGSLVEYESRSVGALPPPTGQPIAARVTYAAAHVVADPLADNTPGEVATLDWDATLAYRRHLWSYGLGVAEAMDTAQRGMGLDWATATELIRRTGAEAASTGGLFAAGVGTDQLGERAPTLAAVTEAYLDQLAVVTEAGARPIVMASRALAAFADSAEDYRRVYDEVLAASPTPVILHWLGPMFDPALAGYWGSDDLDAATATVVELITDHADQVDGIKISLLDAGREVALRRRLPANVRCYSGDDFHYPSLIAGDESGASDALLGIFDPIAPLAAAALTALSPNGSGREDSARFHEILDPSVDLSRHLFAAPTRYYKTGVVFLAWLAGHQNHFRMIGGLESARSVPHLAKAYQLADGLGLFADPELAAVRMKDFLALAGVRA